MLKEVDERRRAERIPAHVEVRFEEVSQAAKALRAYSLNLSAGGLCVRTNRQYEAGATVKLSMTIAGEQLQLEAAVAWVREGAVGLRFLFASPEQRERLERLVSGLSGEAPSGAPPSRPR